MILTAGFCYIHWRCCKGKVFHAWRPRISCYVDRPTAQTPRSQPVIHRTHCDINATSRQRPQHHRTELPHLGIHVTRNNNVLS